MSDYLLLFVKISILLAISSGILLCILVYEESIKLPDTIDYTITIEDKEHQIVCSPALKFCFDMESGK